MANTSATGGFLTGIESTIEGNTLEDFLNSFIVGVTGLTGDLVRPAWQTNPPKMPPSTTDWVAFAITIIDSDQNAYIEQSVNNAILQRQEYGELTTSFYGPNAFTNTKRLRDAVQIGQNRDYLRTYGITTKGTQPLNHIPELIGDIWYNRVDMTIEFAREIRSSYNVLPIATCGTKTIKTETITVQS